MVLQNNNLGAIAIVTELLELTYTVREEQYRCSNAAGVKQQRYKESGRSA